MQLIQHIITAFTSFTAHERAYQSREIVYNTSCYIQCVNSIQFHTRYKILSVSEYTRYCMYKELQSWSSSSRMRRSCFEVSSHSVGVCLRTRSEGEDRAVRGDGEEVTGNGRVF